MIALNPDIVGTALPTEHATWTARDAALYALGIGAGQENPTRELEYTTGNTIGRPQRNYPMFGVVPAAATGVRGLLAVLGDAVDVTTMLHVEQRYEQLTPLPVKGSARIVGAITEAFDKGTATVIETTTEVINDSDGVIYGRSRQTLFFRGVGGWGGQRGTSHQSQRPLRDPDDVIRAQTRPEQALLYRLCGDDNPLHSDPDIAQRAGFTRPILHGLCSYGFVGRLLMNRFAAAPHQFAVLDARFSKPAYPGEALEVKLWETVDHIHFEVENESGEVLLTDGHFALTPADKEPSA